MQGPPSEVGDNFVEATDQSLIRPEDDGADHAFGPPRRLFQRGRSGGPQAYAQAKFNGSLIVVERTHCRFVLANGRGRHGLHRAYDGRKLLGSLDLTAQACQSVAHDCILKAKCAALAIYSTASRSALPSLALSRHR